VKRICQLTPISEANSASLNTFGDGFGFLDQEAEAITLIERGR
jgi:hypothetical protein